jgi:hypothetical protein
MRKGRTVIKKWMRASMDGKFVKEPIAIGTFTDQTLDDRVRGRQTRQATLNANNKKVSKGGLSFSLNMGRKKFKPDAKGAMGTERMQRRNETAEGLGMLQNTIPPEREVGNRSRIKNGELGLKLFVVAVVKATIGHVGKKEFTIHVNSRGTDRMMDKNAIVGARSKPREYSTSGNIDNQGIRSMNIALEILPSCTLLNRRKGGAISKERGETLGKGETSTLLRIPSRIDRRRRRSRSRISSGRRRSNGRSWIGGGGSRSRDGRRGGTTTRRKMKGRKRARSGRNGKRLTTKIAEIGMRSNRTRRR